MRRELAIAAAASAIAFTGCSQDGPRMQITDDLNKQLSPSAVLAISSGWDLYTSRYGCLQGNVLVTKASLAEEAENLPGGQIRQTLEITEPGNISIDPAVVKSADSFTPLDYKNIILHAATHACKPTETKALTQAFRFPDGYLAYAINGFSIRVKSPDGKDETSFTLIEEGAAEALAVLADNSYTTNDEKYFRIGNFTIALINSFSTPREVAGMIQTNDLLRYVGVITNRTDPSPEDVFQVAEWYQEIANGVAQEVIASEIFRYRNS